MNSEPGMELGFPGGAVVKNLPANAGDSGPTLNRKDSLEKEMATHSSILAWKIPQTEEQGVTKNQMLLSN